MKALMWICHCATGMEKLLHLSLTRGHVMDEHGNPEAYEIAEIVQLLKAAGAKK
jgi:hypothetical protein